MLQLPSAGDIAHGSFFILIAGSKTLVSIGQACLTVDATILAINCLAHYHQPSIEYSDATYGFNIFSQITASFFSVLVIALTRYPAIWDKLSLSELQKKLKELQDETADTSTTMKGLLIAIGLAGLLCSLSRGMSAYLGIEVILFDRTHHSETTTKVIGVIAAITVAIAFLCFNLSNMLTNAAKYLKNPTVSCRLSIVVSLIGTLSSAVAMRFFIMHFLDRRHSSTAGQIIGQIVFTFSEIVLGLFTMVSSFDEQWQENAKKILQHSCLLSTIVIGDAITTWLGYNMITWYSILTSMFLSNKIPITDPVSACITNPSDYDFAIRCTFMGIACLIGGPTTFAYFHYLLEYAKNGYDRASSLAQSVYHCCHNGIFGKPQEEEIPLESSFSF